MKRKMFVVLCLIGMCSFAFAGGGNERSAEGEPQYPKGDISVLIAAAAGGGNDLLVRALLPSLERTLKVSVVPVNQPGGRGAIAFNEVASARPDGQKLYFNSKSVLLMKFNGIEEANMDRLVPVAQVAEDVTIFFVRSDSPIKNIKDLINHIKTSKERVKSANSGMGALWHLSQILFCQTIGSDNILSIAYPAGSSAMLTALVSGEVEFVTCGPEAKSFIDAGKVRPLCVVYPGRYPSFPDIPTLKEETGLDYDYPVWRGFFTTEGTDPKVLKILSDALKTAVESEEFKKFTAIGMIASFKDSKTFGEIVDKEQKSLEVLMPGVMAQIKSADSSGGKK
ncbi:MAG: tripartite tricarboxylate transporter substrate binding protein [Spirochaetales bacterium]|jgi:tripartite-type tricarboxylate transporter receptor subunit TctC|nr:tripartite tricarboxylate transporter substrate binding protein [Spirochaetales bacterium]